MSNIFNIGSSIFFREEKIIPFDEIDSESNSLSLSEEQQQTFSNILKEKGYLFSDEVMDSIRQMSI